MPLGRYWSVALHLLVPDKGASVALHQGQDK
jgi:hypothetical protein